MSHLIKKIDGFKFCVNSQFFIHLGQQHKQLRICKAYEDAWVNMSEEEIGYYRSKITPEERYQTLKETWYFHETSSYTTGDTNADRYGCNADACISECDFYPEYGRIENDGHVKIKRSLQSIVTLIATDIDDK